MVTKIRLQSVDEKKLAYSVKEAADVLGMCINSVYSAIKKEQLPAKRIGRKILIPKKALDLWLMNTGAL